MLASKADPVVAAWRAGADAADGIDNPAGPLFFGNSEADLVDEDWLRGTNCSLCTASRPIFCC